MLRRITNERPPARTAGGNKHGRTEIEVIDEDLHVRILKTNTSSSWYVQYNYPGEGQRKQSLRTRNKKEARRPGQEKQVHLRP
jgi:hypothetical protein